MCECQRDIAPVQETKFKGEILPVLLAGGAFDVEHVASFRQGLPSSRKLILIKGYQGLMGRSLVALRALEYCKQELEDYQIRVYSVIGEDVRIAIELLAQRGINVAVQERLPTNDDMLRLFGQARIYVGLSIADGVSTASIQSMITGAFPIQANSACTDEWILDGETGFIVPPEDPHIVAETLRRALTDDDLVDHAAEYNLEVCRARADLKVAQPRVVETYKRVVEQGKKKQ
jgi:glycosyltransferase involved in cell wall biosynthesis